MTSLVLRATSPCALCGYRRPIVRFIQATILAKQIRQEGVALCVGPLRCRECGFHDESSITEPAYRLDAEDQAKVDRARTRHRKPHTLKTGRMR